MNTESLWVGAGAPARSGSRIDGKGKHILYTIALVLIILWLLGLATGYTMGGVVLTGYTMGGVVHVFLVVALVLVLLNLFSRRRGSI